MANGKKNYQNTILDIAEALKLSPATISRALNNHPYVREKTRNDVLEMATKLGYRRNHMASGLRSNRTHTVGLIIPRVSMFFHAEVITTIQNNLHKHGYNLIICQSNDSVAMERELAETLYGSRVDALIAACTLQTVDFSHFDKFVERGTPVIFYDRVPVADYKATLIKGDDFKGAYLATHHLIAAGCKRIAHISGPLTSNLYQDRAAGFLKAMEEHQLPVNPDWVFHQELTHENAMVAMQQMFSAGTVPDGLFADNDTSAIAAIEYAKEKEITVPETLKITGYSNDPRTAIITPAVTSVEQFPNLVGKRIVETLVELLKNDEEGPTYKTEPVIIPVELINRKSTSTN
ncbi:MAG: LacI family DNA-binding transcriptional regulator [Candidatus Pedobacter colombiensis]|uniref:LacI family DNA-binding transcriptional regulator n=1 Tax=Candidatus Pedobacter colombiensis TaxID=3121371 RepID=A0AAJ5W4J9_9SPHI|nr:LacI family DNA-binding transcriptional regulator [Pedobacter sp.]WEK18021.1 MAG: LacI family DNA-binding transcriptional regulator [Pedobacter sp.]